MSWARALKKHVLGLKRHFRIKKSKLADVCLGLFEFLIMIKQQHKTSSPGFKMFRPGVATRVAEKKKRFPVFSLSNTRCTLRNSLDFRVIRGIFPGVTEHVVPWL